MQCSYSLPLRARTPLTVAIVLGGLLLAGCGVPDSDESKPVGQTPAPEVKWFDSYDEAISAAKSTGKPVLVDFTGSDWCGYCIALKNEVFDQPEFKRWANKNVVLLELDYPKFKPQPEKLQKQNERLSRNYGVGGYPTVLFLTADGAELGRSGYMEGGPSNWLKEADRILSRRNTAKTTD